MQSVTIQRAGRVVLRSVLALAASLAIDRIQIGRRPPAPAATVGRLAQHLAAFDPSHVRDSDRITKRISHRAARLERELDQFCLLEARMRRAITRLEATSDHSVTDEAFADLAEQFGILRVRPALERLSAAHPDLPRRSTQLCATRDPYPAA